MEDTSQDQPTNEVRDKQAIQEVLWRYAHALDRRDFDAVGRCFTSDAMARYSGVDVGPGREAIVNHLRNVSRFSRTSHLFSNILVTLERNTATAHTTALSALASGEEGASSIFLRGIRYEDHLDRGPDGWAISRRVHNVDWMIQAPEVPAGPMW